MVRLLADENFNGRIVRGLFLRKPDLDLVRAQDVGLSKKHDDVLLEWTASENRILLTHDYQTIPKHAYHRVTAACPCRACMSPTHTSRCSKPSKIS